MQCGNCGCRWIDKSTVMTEYDGLTNEWICKKCGSTDIREGEIMGAAPRGKCQNCKRPDMALFKTVGETKMFCASCRDVTRAYGPGPEREEMLANKKAALQAGAVIRKAAPTSNTAAHPADERKTTTSEFKIKPGDIPTLPDDLMEGVKSRADVERENKEADEEFEHDKIKLIDAKIAILDAKIAALLTQYKCFDLASPSPGISPELKSVMQDVLESVRQQSGEGSPLDLDFSNDQPLYERLVKDAKKCRRRSLKEHILWILDQYFLHSCQPYSSELTCGIDVQENAMLLDIRLDPESEKILNGIIESMDSVRQLLQENADGIATLVQKSFQLDSRRPPGAEAG